MPPVNSTYTKVIPISDNYTVKFGDDVIVATIATAKTATLPKAGTCTPQTQQNVKQIINSANSSDTLTIAVQSGDTLLGIGSLAAGQTAYLTSNGTSVWTGFGAGGQAGTSGYSGVSGFSGVSGYSGFTGVSGYSGFTGVSGYSGFSGASGYSGFSGYSGYSGISGYSGYSGVSGYSGFSG
jgi:collagen triple helix repeat protein